MGDDNGGKLLRNGKLAQQPKHFDLVTDVQVSGGLIEQNQARSLSERPREHRTLELSAADFRHQASAEFGQVGLIERPIDPVLVLRGLKKIMPHMWVPSLPHKLSHTERKQQRGILARKTHALGAPARRESVEVLTLEQDATMQGLQPATGDIKQSRFPRTVGSDDGDEFACKRLKARRSQFEMRVAEGNALDGQMGTSSRFPAFIFDEYPNLLLRH